jgi:hypothetical protein
MSAPQTNIEKQRRRHIGPLIGITVVLIFVGAILMYWLTYEAAEGASPTDPTAAERDLPVSPLPPEVIPPQPQVDPTDSPVPLQGNTPPQPAPQGQ